MPALDRCLDDGEVRALLADLLPLDQMTPVLDHLERCPRCTALVAQQGANRTPVSADGMVDTLAEKESSAVEGLLARLYERIGQFAPSTPGDSTLSLDGSSAGSSGEPFSFLMPAQQPDEMGRLSRYRILSVLGSGGMGVVFLAEDSVLQRRVALKVMRPELSRSGDFRERFLREARAVANIEHDHIVTVYHVEEDSGVQMLAMQLLQGETLEDRLRREKRLSAAETARIGRETAEALRAAHERGLIHRDIKPANVWLAGQRGRVKVLDFGLARGVAESSQLTQSGVVLGTPAYMAPEQADGAEVDARADLFSLGAVLYRMATGEPPFRGATPLAILKSLANDTPRPAHQVNPAIPPALGNLIQRLLSKPVADRPSSAAQVARELTRLETDGTAVPPAPAARIGTEGTGQPTPPEVARGRTEPAPQSEQARPRRGRLVLAATAAALLLAGMLLAGVVLTIKSPRGDVLLTVADGDVSVYLDGEKQDGIEPGKGKRLTLKPGRHQLTVRRGGEEVFASTFDVKAGETAMLDVPAGPMGVSTRPAAGHPLDRLRHDDVPPLERFDSQRKELVAVLGSRRWRYWGRPAHGGPLPRLSFSEGKRLVLTSAFGDTMRVADAETGEELSSFRRPRRLQLSEGFYTLAADCSRDGKQVAMLGGNSADWSWTVWDVPTARVRTTLRFREVGPTGVFFSADGQVLAILAPGLQLWNGRTGEPREVLSDSRVNGDPPIADFSPDGKLLAWAAQHRDGDAVASWQMLVHVYDLDAGREKYLFKRPGMPWAASVLISPDGKTLAVGGGHPADDLAPIQLWDLSTGKEGPALMADGKPIMPRGFAFSPDSKSIACGLPGAIKIYDCITGKECQALLTLETWRCRWCTRPMVCSWQPPSAFCPTACGRRHLRSGSGT
jgi:WD40 repeat protein/tRNA A-37 threonylcarbamoyl transferase component Bud32